VDIVIAARGQLAEFVDELDGYIGSEQPRTILIAIADVLGTLRDYQLPYDRRLDTEMPKARELEATLQSLHHIMAISSMTELALNLSAADSLIRSARKCRNYFSEISRFLTGKDTQVQRDLDQYDPQSQTPQLLARAQQLYDKIEDTIFPANTPSAMAPIDAGHKGVV
jgi:hypothetical protein